MTNDDLKKELSRCLSCRLKPCEKACPLGVSPHDFILAAKSGEYQQAARLIASKNPLQQTCGLVCPSIFCQAACIRRKIDYAIQIPCLQALMIEKGGLPPLPLPEPNGKKAAVIGAGPAGLGAVFELIKNGFYVDLYEKESTLGGAVRLIPQNRLPKAVLDKEIARLTQNDRVTVHLNTEITDFQSVKAKYDTVILSLGEPIPRTLGIKGEEHCISYKEYLQNPTKYQAEKIAVCGGGEVALDCALTANANVEMFVRRRREDMRIDKNKHDELDKKGVVIRALTSITEINKTAATCTLTTISNQITPEGKAAPCPETKKSLSGYGLIIQALGSYYPKDKIPAGFITAGDMTGTTGTVVEALSSGIHAAKKAIEELK